MHKLTEQRIEELAQALHEWYIQAQIECGVPSNLPADWDKLPEKVKALNRAQIREFPALVERCGTEDIEALARGVHDCWMRNCVEKSDLRMVDYDELPEAEKEKDRTIVKFFYS